MSNSTTDNTREQIYLAALLHDIGKFWQRADENGLNGSKFIPNEFKEYKYTFCPENEMGLSHKHVMWTAYFIEKYNSVFKNLLNDRNYGDFMHLASRHHHATNLEERIIQKADHYSSGLDRTQDNGWKDAVEENDNNWDAFKRIKMRSIFGSVGSYSYLDVKAPINSLQITREFIEYDEEKVDYSYLWNEFEKEFKFIQNSNFKSFVETLLNLFYKYTVRIPSSTQSYPDVSLFDHLKTTAAFALSLTDYIKSKNSDTLPTPYEKPFILIGGDLSGIQKFIYTIAARGAAKNLKGRSFYLQLLVDNIVQNVLDKLNLFSANVVYQSGGGFYIIAPNTEDTIKRLRDISRNIESKLFEYHKTELYLAVDYVEFGEKNIIDANIGIIWDELHNKLKIKKNQRFINIVKDQFEILFQPNKNFNPDSKRDYITGEILKDKTNILDEENPDSIVNEYTYQQIELGKKLKDADFWIISTNKINYWNDRYFNPIGLGYYNYFVSLEDIREKEDNLRSSADKVIVRRINNIDFLEPVQKGIDNSYGIVFYGGNDYPKDENNLPKTFEEIAGVTFKDNNKSEREYSPNLVRLGILRLDVDNLGYIFKEGFSGRKGIIPSFSRYSTLSRNLDLFFTGYINTLWESKDEYKSYTQIIYAGGDDVFIVGKWDVLINMAKDIHDKFKIWTCNNPLFGLSGGIAVVQPKFPILKAAELAETEEKNAKGNKLDTKEKDSISLFGFAYRWDEEFEFILKLKDEIKYLLDKGLLAQNFSSVMFNLMRKAYPQNKEQIKNSDETFKYRVKWLVAYNFKRAADRSIEDENKEFLKKWGKYIFTGMVEELAETNYDALQILAIAARWADLELRSTIETIVKQSK